MNAGTALSGTVPALLAARAIATPDAPAFCVEASGGRWQALSWREFESRVAALRLGLAAQGLRPGDRLALIAPVSLEWELLHHAALSMGVVVVGLDAHDLPERLAAMAELADASAFAVNDAKCLSAMAPHRLTGARFVLRLGQAQGPAPHGARILDWSGLLAPGVVPAPPPPAPTAGDPATIIFTSGTTGAPKGIQYSHGQLCLAIEAICEAFAFIGPDSRLLCWLPLSNLFQRIVNLAGVRNGPCTYLLGDPRRVMEVVADVSPDIFVGVPRFYEKLYAGVRESIAAQPGWRRSLAQWSWQLGRRVSRHKLAGRRPPAPLRVAHAAADWLVLRKIRGVMGTRLRCMVTGSAPAPVQLLEEFHALGWLVLEAYGLSENVVPMAMNRLEAFRFGTVGRPVVGNEISVDEEGAVKVRGAGVFAGYLGEREGLAYDAGSFYPTGDVGSFDADGYLKLTGRRTDMIKTSTGRRVAPADVEAGIRSVPGVDHAILIGNGRKCLVALCTCTPAARLEPDRSRLREALRLHTMQIGQNQRPLAIALLAQPFSLEAGELTSNLKIKRNVIETRYEYVIQELLDRINDTSSPGTTNSVAIIDF